MAAPWVLAKTVVAGWRIYQALAAFPVGSAGVLGFAYFMTDWLCPRRRLERNDFDEYLYFL